MNARGSTGEVEVVELETEDELEAAYPVMHELRDHLDLGAYQRLLADMRPAGYRMFAAKQNGEIVALAGIGFGTNFYYGRYLWVYDLITTASGRSRGHGKKLLDHLEALARERRCHTIALSSVLHREDAHRFYEDRADYQKTGFTFVKDLRK
jgi:GNAT superfamily N-acetyltransferase